MNDTRPYTCEEVRARLDDYLDQELAPSETCRMLEHLHRCARCADASAWAYAELAEMREAVQRLTPPEGLLQRLSERLTRFRQEDRGLSF